MTGLPTALVCVYCTAPMRSLPGEAERAWYLCIAERCRATKALGLAPQ